MSDSPHNVFLGHDAISGGSLKGLYKHRWVEDSFFYDEPVGRHRPLPSSNIFIGTSFGKSQAIFFFLSILFVLGIILGRVVQLQLIEGSYYQQLSDTNRQRIIPIPSERGLVFDRHGVELTKNIPNFSLALIPQDLPRDKEEREYIVQRLSAVTNQDEEGIRETIEKYGNYSYESIVVQEDLDYDTALSIQIAASDLPGIHIQRGSKRLYLHPESVTGTASTLSHLLGYQGKLNPEELDELYGSGYLPSDNIGKTALEKYYETDLRGEYGRRTIEVDALGKQQKSLSEEAPTPGKHLTLTIDTKIQGALERVMREAMEQAGKTRGVGVVMHPQNGEVLALVSLPTFDNNDFSGGIDYETYQSYVENTDNPLFHRAISGTYPSGSVVKPAVATAALQEGLITPNTSFLSNGGVAVGQWFFPDWQSGGHGVTNVRRSIAWSVNTFYYYIGGGYKDFVGLGVDTITSYLRKYGLASQLGIDLPGEQAGFLPSKSWKEQVKEERWYVGDTYNLSIGQGDLLVTPLQVAAMTSAIANGGTLYQPHMVQKVTDPVTKEGTVKDAVVLEDSIVSRFHIQTVRLGMKDCVDYGSCRRLASLPFTVAGKTGTAQWNRNKDDHAWFTSFAPFDNPEVVLTILVEEGEGGSTIGAPIAHEFYKWWANYR